MKIEARGITRKFDRKTALRGVDLLLEGTGVHVLAGPNGSGKTTILRILSLLERPDSGELYMDGLPVDHKTGWEYLLRLRRRMAMVHAPAVMLAGSVRDNIGYGLAVRGTPLRQRLEKTAEVMEKMGLSGFERRDASTLSAGETQRVALARAVAVSPEILLLDEPTANLDPLSVSLVEEAISVLAAGGTCILLATHHPGTVASPVKKVFEMNDGMIIRCGAPETGSSKV